MYLHIDVNSEGVDDVYLYLHKIDFEPIMQLKVGAVAKHGKWISFEFNSLNNVNGKYSMRLVSSTGPSSQPIVWDLGTIDVWFREG